MPTLTLISIVNSATNGDLNNIKDLQLSKKNFDKIEDLGACKELRKVDLSENSLRNFEVFHYILSFLTISHKKQGISHNYSLVMINLSHNLIETMPDLQELANLTVLNLSFNKVFRDFFENLKKTRKRSGKYKA